MGNKPQSSKTFDDRSSDFVPKRRTILLHHLGKPQIRHEKRQKPMKRPLKQASCSEFGDSNARPSRFLLYSIAVPFDTIVEER